MRYAKQRSRLKRENEPALLRPNRIVAVALTHGHLDHTWGLLPFLQTLSLDGRQQPLMVYGPTSEAILDALLSDGIDAKLSEDTPSAELLNQYRSWFSLGGTEQNLGFPFNGSLENLNRVDGSNLLTMQQDLFCMNQCRNQMHSSRSEWIRFLPSHSVPSCAWQLSRKERKGAFDRDKATLAGLNQEERKQLSEGIDLKRENGDELQASQFRESNKASR